MSVLASELIVVGCANRAEADTETVGGAPDKSVKMSFTDLSANDVISVISDNTGSASQWTITGKSATGAAISETITTVGTTIVSTSSTFSTIDKIVMTSSAGTMVAGETITFYSTSSGDPLFTAEEATVSTTGADITETRKVWYGAASSSSAYKYLYDKVFWYNTNATTALNDANVRILSFVEPGTLDVFVALSTSIGATGDSESVTDREGIAPTSVTSFIDDGFDTAVQSTPTTGTLDATYLQGVWLRLYIPQSHAAVASNSFSLRLSGTTT